MRLVVDGDQIPSWLLFVRINPEVIHPSVIATMSGVKEFVKFGGEICVISDRSGLSPSIVEAIDNILCLQDKLSRQVALMELIQQDAMIKKATCRDNLS